MFRINQGQFYGAESFKPSNIIKKIIMLQIIFYLMASLFLGLIGTIGGIGYSFKLLFDSTKLSFGFGEGYIPIVSFTLSSFPWYVHVIIIIIIAIKLRFCDFFPIYTQCLYGIMDYKES